MKKHILISIFCFAWFFNYAQFNNTIGKKFMTGRNYLEKKFLIGGTFNNSWSTYLDLQGKTAFTKPSLGIYFKAEYYPLGWLGISVGLGHQQRGCGIITPDHEKSLGNPDSTHRLRIRTNNLAIPLMLTLRSPFHIFKGGKLSLGFGIVPSMVYDAKSVFHSIEDGFHERIEITDQFTEWDMPLRGTFGIDVNAANACLFRFNFVADYGFTKMWKDPASGTISGKNLLYGLELSFLF